MAASAGKKVIDRSIGRVNVSSESFSILKNTIFAAKIVLERSTVFNEVYQAYKKDRAAAADISELAFERLLKIYPALMVISSDGFVDLSEADYLSFLASQGTEIPQAFFSQEIKNLYFHQGHWRNLFIKVIKEFAQDESVSIEILMNMIYAAACSTGSIVKNILLAEFKPQNISLDSIQSLEQIDPTKQFFSDQEKQKILQFAEDLDLLKDPKIKDKLYQLFGT